MEHISLHLTGTNIQRSASNSGFDYTVQLFEHFVLVLVARRILAHTTNPKLRESKTWMAKCRMPAQL